MEQLTQHCCQDNGFGTLILHCGFQRPLVIFPREVVRYFSYSPELQSVRAQPQKKQIKVACKGMVFLLINVVAISQNFQKKNKTTIKG